MPESLLLNVVRPDDLLVLRLQFDNVDVDPPQGAQPGQVRGAGGARLTVHFQAQHIGEQAFFQASQDHQEPVGSDETPATPGQVRARLAGATRLVFDVPGTESIPLTLEGVLDALQRLPLRVSAVNRYRATGCLPIFRIFGPRPPAVTQPAADETAIEAPFRLIVSPDETATWRHAATPVVHGDWVELWHTRLGSTQRGGDPNVRAIWSPDFVAGSLPETGLDPFRMSLQGKDRNQLVHLTSNYLLTGHRPTPVDTEQFDLSTLGAWFKVDGNWEVPSPNSLGLDIVHWRHEATMGRDQFVRVVKIGHLLPYGHRAVKVEITERKFLHREDASTPGNIAYLYKRVFIIVRELRKSYSRREMPLRTVGFKTRLTPNLVDPATTATAADVNAFWPRIDMGSGPKDFHFHMWGLDWEGRRIEWSTPLIFVSDAVTNNLAAVVNEYNAIASTAARRAHQFDGQEVAFAPAVEASDTTYEVFRFSPKAIAEPGGSLPPFRPAMDKAQIDIPAVKNLLGKTVPTKVEFETSFLSGSGSGIGNKGDVFLNAIDVPDLNFATEKVGGMVAPDMGIRSLSRALGPVGGNPGQMVAGEFRPADIFADTVKLLGGIKLSDILEALDVSVPSTAGGAIPGLTTKRVGDVIRTCYKWSIDRDKLKDIGLYVPGNNATFSLDACVDAPLDGTPPTFTIWGELTDFKTLLLPAPDAAQLVELSFDAVRFTSEPGGKTDVKVELAEIRFINMLEFVNELKDGIPVAGFNIGPHLEVSSAGVDVGFTFGIPSIGVGIMTLQNISLSSSVFLPFKDDPLNFHFGFCERQQPFILTVSLFGGGGFFSIDVGVDGVKMIEGALEFGASAAINLGVASGEATMMAGFYFQMAGADFELTGYFRAYGSLSVIGIITVSLEFYLGLSFENKGSDGQSKLWGQASLTVKIEILFFSTSVSVSMEREFAGSDPKFIEMVTPSHWQQYTDAFGAYP